MTTRYIVEEKEVCGTCEHYRQHYIMGFEGKMRPLWYGHCGVPRGKRRAPDESCPHWKSSTRE